MREVKEARLNNKQTKMDDLTKEATTHTEMKPFDNKDWRNTEKIEIVFSIETDTEKRVFKGLIDLTGIIKK